MSEKKPVSLQQAVRQLPMRSQTQTAAIGALILVVAVIIGALYLAQATTTASTGQQFFQLESTRDYLQRANEDTEWQIAAKRDISTLRGRAQALGFILVDTDHLSYLVVNGYSPFRATPTPVITAVPVIQYDETFSGWVQQEGDTLAKQFEAWSGRATPTPTPVR